MIENQRITVSIYDFAVAEPSFEVCFTYGVLGNRFTETVEKNWHEDLPKGTLYLDSLNSQTLLTLAVRGRNKDILYHSHPIVSFEKGLEDCTGSTQSPYIILLDQP